MKLNYRIWLSCLLLLTAFVCRGQTFVTLGQRVVVRPLSEVSNSAYLTVSGNYLYFVGINATNGVELWRTDGKPGGTRIVKDITTAPNLPTGVQGLRDVQGTLFFTPQGGTQLWKTDGTEAGTVLIKGFKDIVSVKNVYKNLLFFTPSPVDTIGLWRTDGTPDGTFQISPNRSISSTVVYQDFAYFWFTSGPTFKETTFMRTDGTVAGTTVVKQLPGGVQGVTIGVGGLYIRLLKDPFTSLSEYADWRSDGTPAGTVEVVPYATTRLPVFVNVLDDLYTYNKSTQSATVVTRQNKSTGVFEQVLPTPDLDVLFHRSALYGGQLYSSTHKPATGNELRRWDGTPVRDIAPGPASGTVYARPVVFNNRLYFPANDGTTGLELWQTDGTEAGTRLVSDLLPGTGSSAPLDLTLFRNELYLNTRDGTLLKLTADPPAPTGTLAFQVLSYDCNTGQIRYRLTGGNNTPIALNIPGLSTDTVQANAELTYTLPRFLRLDAGVTGTATQSGQVLPIAFLTGCTTITPPAAIAPASVPPATGGPLAFNMPVFNCDSGLLTVGISGGDGQPVEFSAPGLRDWSSGNVFIVPAWQRNGTTFAINARQSGKQVSTTYTTTCSAYASLSGSEPGADVVLAWPNPTGDLLTVQLARPLPAQAVFTLVDMAGRTYPVGPAVIASNSGRLQIPVRSLPTGQYLLQIGGAGLQPRVVRFVKQ